MNILAIIILTAAATLAPNTLVTVDYQGRAAYTDTITEQQILAPIGIVQSATNKGDQAKITPIQIYHTYRLPVACLEGITAGEPVTLGGADGVDSVMHTVNTDGTQHMGPYNIIGVALSSGTHHQMITVVMIPPQKYTIGVTPAPSLGNIYTCTTRITPGQLVKVTDGVAAIATATDTTIAGYAIDNPDLPAGYVQVAPLQGLLKAPVYVIAVSAAPPIHTPLVQYQGALLPLTSQEIPAGTYISYAQLTETVTAPGKYYLNILANQPTTVTK
jgi:hypothetical protein